LKSTYFFHDAEDSFQWNGALEAYDNSGRQKRQGLEFELQSIPWNNLVMELNFTYVHLEKLKQENGYQREANLIIRYDNPNIISVELAGHYARYGDLHAPPAYKPVDDTVLWDINFNKQLWKRDNTKAKIFLVIHNLSNESQYNDELFKNGPRWMEIGLNFSF
ncbi:MAG: hypothetical protein OEM02_02020, partial [Desulfobulbaceae bacterium]|nr:hypothetical protein [Desulfobulbaceae bacterium]